MVPTSSQFETSFKDACNGTYAQVENARHGVWEKFAAQPLDSLQSQASVPPQPPPWGHPDMLSASKGGWGHRKADVEREVTRIYEYKSDPNADKGGGGQKIMKCCGHH